MGGNVIVLEQGSQGEVDADVYHGTADQVSPLVAGALVDDSLHFQAPGICMNFCGNIWQNLPEVVHQVEHTVLKQTGEVFALFEFLSGKARAVGNLRAPEIAHWDKMPASVRPPDSRFHRVEAVGVLR